MQFVRTFLNHKPKNNVLSIIKCILHMLEIQGGKTQSCTWVRKDHKAHCTTKGWDGTEQRVIGQPISAAGCSPGGSEYSATSWLPQCHCQLWELHSTYLQIYARQTSGSPVVLLLLICINESLSYRSREPSYTINDS